MGNNIITIAIVDDYKKLRDGIKTVLQEMGFEIILEAEHGQDFFDKLEESAVIPNVCLMDLRMPVMDGFAAIEAIRERQLPIKIIAYSNESGYTEQAITAGADTFFSKDDNPYKLKQLIEEMMTV